jgi:hypothetical protein
MIFGSVSTVGKLVNILSISLKIFKNQLGENGRR